MIEMQIGGLRRHHAPRHRDRVVRLVLRTLPPVLTSRQMRSASWRACARFMCGRKTVKRSPDRRHAKLSAPTSARRIATPQRAITRSPSENPARSLIRCRRSMSPYSIDTIAVGGALRCQESTRVLNPAHDSRPVSESRSCVALRASRRANRARRRTVNSSKLGSSGRLKMMSAPAGPPRAISGTATSLQATCAAARVLEFVRGHGLAGIDRAAREFIADDGESVRARTRDRLPSGPTRRAIPSRGNTAVAAVHPSRRQTARNTLSVLRSDFAPASSDLVSADFTGFSAALFFSAVLARSED